MVGGTSDDHMEKLELLLSIDVSEVSNTSPAHDSAKIQNLISAFDKNNVPMRFSTRDDDAWAGNKCPIPTSFEKFIFEMVPSFGDIDKRKHRQKLHREYEKYDLGKYLKNIIYK